MKSMTAYVRLEKEIEGTPISFEIKSYNSRYLDIKINLAHWIKSLEFFIREYFSSKILRGSVEISLSSGKSSPMTNLTLDGNTAKKYVSAFTELAETLGLSYEPDIKHIASQPGVLSFEEAPNLENWKKELITLFDLALYSFNEIKKAEGEACQVSIEKQLHTIDEALSFIETIRESIEADFAKSLRKKFEDLLGTNYDEMRVLQELAVMLNKYTIEEELVRLRAHLLAMKKEMTNEGASAKRLDFICQEMNREINTIASKNTSYKIAEKVISVKEAIENIREQLRNLE